MVQDMKLLIADVLKYMMCFRCALRERGIHLRTMRILQIILHKKSGRKET